MGKGEMPELVEEPIEVRNSINAFRSWVHNNDIEWLEVEKKIYHRKEKYAGTLDAVAKIKGQLCVIDFKTSNKIYKDYYLQIAAYAKALEDMYGEPVPVCYIMRFDKDSGKFQEKCIDPDAHWDAFLAAKLLSGWHSKRVTNFDPSLKGPDNERRLED